MERIKKYYYLTKPGIVQSNTMTGAAGFLLAAHRDIHVTTLIAALLGLALVIASACVTNNYIDRPIDSKMSRTKRRALIQGTVSGSSALTYAVVLGITGTASLLLFTNTHAALLAVFGYFAYVVIYGIGKRRTVHGTLIGTISGAMPPVIGYCAASNRLDLTALLLFLILVCWQMPHFYAIAVFRLSDYKAAHIPVLPAVHGIKATKIQAIAYSALFILAAASLTIFGYTGYIYLIICLLLGFAWLWFNARGLRVSGEKADIRWARQMFGFSLLVLLVWSATVAADSLLNLV